MKLQHYTVIIVPDDGEAHKVGDGIDAPSALGALIQVVERALKHGTDGPVLVLDEDDELRELEGFKYKEA